jgi:ribose 1,5-bisphosphate isomerase
MTEKYSEIKKIYDDIKNLNVQGATNVAIATIEGMKLYVEISKEKDKELFYKEVLQVGSELSLARENEPMARNCVTFVKYSFGQKFSDLPEVNTMKREIGELCDKFLDMVAKSKKDLLDKSTNFFGNFSKVFTHCHSSTAVSLIVSMSKGSKNFKAVCTETRPRFQGRKTAQNLLNAGIDTTLIADSAGESFIIGRGSIPVEIVFIGCDKITAGGHTVNKIGSWGLAMAAHYADKPMYVVTPILKMDPDSYIHDLKIEVRESSELWEDAPKGLHMYNPAFEIVDSRLITGYITELGIIKANEIEKVALQQYPWILQK